MADARGHLLVVDDSRMNRVKLVRHLEQEGHTVAQAEDGRRALELLQLKPFDLVLLDIMMPEVDGYQVLAELKGDARLREIPVVVISAVDEMDSVVRCIEMGAEDYLPKAFDPVLLRARIDACLEKKRLRDQASALLHRLEAELQETRRLQLNMVPQTFPTWSAASPVEVYALTEPAQEVGGDLYDFFFAAPGTLCFLVGDASGKGAPAALFMARTRSLVRMSVALWQRATGEILPPDRIVQAVNEELCQDNRDRMFMTLLLGILDLGSGVVRYTNAGHVAPYRLCAPEGDVETGDAAPDLPLGVRSTATFRVQKLSLRPGEGLFVFSDGVPEATDAKRAFYTKERLANDLRALGGQPGQTVVETIKSNVDAFVADAPRFDDLTMLAVRWQPHPGG